MMNEESSETKQLIGVEALKAALRYAPLSPGIYRMLNNAGEIMYIGKARQLKNRLSQYTQIGQLGGMKLRMVNQIAAVEWTITRNEGEALLLEANLIKKHQPRYNVLLRDDKSFPYIMLDETLGFARIGKHRGKGALKTPKETFLFGPFPSAGAVDATIAVLQKAFLLRNCSDSMFASRTRPCLQYQIKRCSAPCVDYVSKEQYGDLVAQAKAFLSGKNTQVQEELRAQMTKASEALEYERAASLRDRLTAISRMAQKTVAHANAIGEADVFALHRTGNASAMQVMFYRGGQYFGGRAYFPTHTSEASDQEVMEAFLGQFYATRQAPSLLLLSHALEDLSWLEEALSQQSGRKVAVTVPQRGEKKQAVEQALENARDALARKQAETMQQGQWLDELAQRLALPRVPARIEVYDNSHIQGRHAVGGMVVFGAEGWAKKHYRTFNFPVEEIDTGDDYAMLRAVLTRRLRRLKEEKHQPGDGMWPDLMLIDGGLGQLGVAQDVLAESGLENIELLAIAKGPDRNAGREQFFRVGQAPFQWPVNDGLLHFMQRLRDEAHRFAIGTHRNKRSRALTQSPLDGIEGIGPTRKKALLRHFGSARAISNASVAEIAAVAGVSDALAQTIFDYFHA